MMTVRVRTLRILSRWTEYRVNNSQMREILHELLLVLSGFKQAKHRLCRRSRKSSSSRRASGADVSPLLAQGTAPAGDRRNGDSFPPHAAFCFGRTSAE